MPTETTMIFTGDSFITRRLPEDGYEGFGALHRIIQDFQVRFTNSEITVHDEEGYPDAQSGGTWAMTEPPVLDDLLRYGFNLFNTANNHTVDYGHGGLLATIANLNKRGYISAGAGRNLAAACRPAYLETKDARVALIGACSTGFPTGIAGNQSPTMQGRPGLNPLRFNTTYHVTRENFEHLEGIASATNLNAWQQRLIDLGYEPPLPEGSLNFGGLQFVASEEDYLSTTVHPGDMQRIRAAIDEATRQADYAIVSIHAHEALDGDPAKPAEFLREFAHEAIDCGADAIIGHGPHELRGIEIYNGKPIFYSLGNFIFQTETVTTQPADAFEKHAMPTDTGIGSYMDSRSQNGTRGYPTEPHIWTSVMAGIRFTDGAATQIELYPIDLSMDKPRSRRGTPTPAAGTETLEYLADLSGEFGTKIRIRDGVGLVDIR